MKLTHLQQKRILMEFKRVFGSDAKWLSSKQKTINDFSYF